MSTLSIRLFGGVRADLQDRSLGSFPTRWAAGLLGYLALHRGRLVHRDVLTATFWPEETDARARKSLRNALWRLRGMVEPDGVEPETFLEVEGQTVGLRSGASIWIDVEAFERRVEGVDRGRSADHDLEALAEAVELYRGDLMDGHDHEWCVYERQRLRLALLSAQERLMEAHMARGEWPAALRRGQAVVHLDPLREHVHRRMMLCHYWMGDRPLAIRQYRACTEVLSQELGITPMEETRRLHERIRAGETVAHEGVPAGVTRLPSWERLDPRVTRALGRAEAALVEIRSLTRRLPVEGGLEGTA